MKSKYEQQLKQLTEKHCKNIPHALSGLKAAFAIEAKKKTGYNQEQLAEKLGITQASVSYYLHGIRGYASILMKRQPEIRKEIRKMAEGVD